MFGGFGGFLIIPKWYILTPGHMAILFGEEKSTKYGPQAPYLLQKCFKTIRKYVNVFKHFSVTLGIKNVDTFVKI